MDFGCYQLCKVLSELTSLWLSFTMDRVVNILSTLQGCKEWNNVWLSSILRTFRKRLLEPLSLGCSIWVEWGEGMKRAEIQQSQANCCFVWKESLFLFCQCWKGMFSGNMVPASRRCCATILLHIEVFPREFSWSSSDLLHCPVATSREYYLGLDLRPAKTI
jgi:hypothetical protein